MSMFWFVFVGNSMRGKLGSTKLSPHDELVRFRPRKPLDLDKWTLHKPNFCADAHG